LKSLEVLVLGPLNSGKSSLLKSLCRCIGETRNDDQIKFFNITFHRETIKFSAEGNVESVAMSNVRYDTLIIVLSIYDSFNFIQFEKLCAFASFQGPTFVVLTHYDRVTEITAQEVKRSVLQDSKFGTALTRNIYFIENYYEESPLEKPKTDLTCIQFLRQILKQHNYK